MTTPGMRSEVDRLDRRITAALSQRPAVPISADFAARVASQAGTLNVKPLHRPPSWGWGQVASIVSLVLLLALLFCSGAAPGPGLLLNQLTLAGEFLVLLLGDSYFRRTFF